LETWFNDRANLEMRCFVAQNASPLLLAYWLGVPLPEVENNPVWAVDEAAPLLYHLLNRDGWKQTVKVDGM
jgi:hypothetical protein